MEVPKFVKLVDETTILETFCFQRNIECPKLKSKYYIKNDYVKNDRSLEGHLTPGLALFP